MKKRLQGFIAGILVCSIFMMSPVWGVGVTKNIKAVFNSVTVKINGKTLTGDKISYNGNVFVNTKSIANLVGKNYKTDKNGSISFEIKSVPTHTPSPSPVQDTQYPIKTDMDTKKEYYYLADISKKYPEKKITITIANDGRVDILFNAKVVLLDTDYPRNESFKGWRYSYISVEYYNNNLKPLLEQSTLTTTPPTITPPTTTPSPYSGIISKLKIIEIDNVEYVSFLSLMEICSPKYYFLGREISSLNFYFAYRNEQNNVDFLIREIDYKVVDREYYFELKLCEDKIFPYLM